MSRRQQAQISKRQTVREQRLKKQRQQRLTLILGISLVALVVAGLLAYPSIKAANTPVGDIIEITPQSWPMADGRALGDPNAPVKIEVYEDFQCPSCQVYTQNIEPQIVQNYVATGKVYYVFRHYPFIDDRVATKESDQAANASMCAAEQGRFWDYHEILFANWRNENQGAFNDKRLVAFAETLGLDMNSFNSCFEENRYKDEINQDLLEGEKVSVTGTPSVYVNGQQISPGFIPSYEDIQAAVETALAGAGG